MLGRTEVRCSLCENGEIRSVSRRLSDEMSRRTSNRLGGGHALVFGSCKDGGWVCEVHLASTDRLFISWSQLRIISPTRAGLIRRFNSMCDGIEAQLTMKVLAEE